MRIHWIYGAVEGIPTAPGSFRILAEVLVTADRGDGSFSQSILAEGSEIQAVEEDFVASEAPTRPVRLADLPWPHRMRHLASAAGLPDQALAALVAEMRAISSLSFGERRSIAYLERQLEVRARHSSFFGPSL